MGHTDGTMPDRFTPALSATNKLLVKELNEILRSGWMEALSAHFEIEHAGISAKSVAFYRHLLPLRQKLVSVLADNYRRYFKLALAHPHQTEPDPHGWALGELQSASREVEHWIRGWYILACDGARPMASAEFIPGQTLSLSIPTTVQPDPPPETWRAPAWLFQISLPLVGFGLINQKHVQETNSEEKLDAAHTRLLLKGARRVFRWDLEAAIGNVRNEETAAAGTIPAALVHAHTRKPNQRKGWERRLKLYSAIQKALSNNPELQGVEFCAELDKRHAPPLYDWTKRGEWQNGLTWKEAWNNPRLREKVRRVRQEAMKNR